MAKIVMLGSGIMATALSFPASENGNEVRLVGTHLDRDIIDSIKTKGIHPDLGLTKGVKHTSWRTRKKPARTQTWLCVGLIASGSNGLASS